MSTVRLPPRGATLRDDEAGGLHLGPVTITQAELLMDWLAARGCPRVELSLGDDGFYLSFGPEQPRTGTSDELAPLPAVLAYPTTLLLKALKAG